MSGFRAFQVFSAMNLHFSSKNPYDGFKYNFKTKQKPEDFEKNHAVRWQFEKLAKDHPSDIELLKFYYPTFRELGFVAPRNLGSIKKHHKAFLDELEAFLSKQYSVELNALVNSMPSNPSEVYNGSIDGLPILYDRYLSKTVSFEFCLLFNLMYPEALNRSSSYFGYDDFLGKIKLHSPFIQMYLANQKLIELKTETKTRTKREDR